ncbi:MAG: hypothetical protein ACAH95_11260, partial [Fimbriimonas sp.]
MPTGRGGVTIRCPRCKVQRNLDPQWESFFSEVAPRVDRKPAPHWQSTAVLLIPALAVIVGLLLIRGAPPGAHRQSPSLAAKPSSSISKTDPVITQRAKIEPAGTEDVPRLLSWRIGDIDARFGLSGATANRLVSRAVKVWEDAAGRQLFSQANSGFPIEWQYDVRQEKVKLYQSAKETIRASDSELAALKEELRQAKERFEAAKTA